VAHWPLDETTGLTANNIAGAHDGSLLGFSTDDSQWVAGHLNGALAFDGTDDYVGAEGYPGVCGKNPRAVLAWIKTQPDTTDTLSIIAWGQNEPDAYWLVEVDADQRLRLSTGSGFISAGQQQIGDGAWHHVAVVLDPADAERPLISDVSLYVDGMRRTIYRMREAEIDTGCVENLRIGAAHGPSNNTFAGAIDEVTIFDAAVSPTAIRRAHIK